jgi:tRNA(fMet)-specific endonuclease VapC
LPRPTAVRRKRLSSEESKAPSRCASRWNDPSPRYEHLYPLSEWTVGEGSTPLEEARENEIVLCSIVKAELLFGAFKSARRAENLAKVERFAGRFTSLPFDDAAALSYAEIRAALERAGTPIGPNDLLIAAIAVTYDTTLVTENVDEFARVPKLRWEAWG